MTSDIITISPPSSNFTGWIDIDVSGTALDGVQPGTAVVINPTNKNLNLTIGGLIVAFVSAPNVISFGVKLMSGPVDLLVSI